MQTHEIEMHPSFPINTHAKRNLVPEGDLDYGALPVFPG